MSEPVVSSFAVYARFQQSALTVVGKAHQTMETEVNTYFVTRNQLVSWRPFQFTQVIGNFRI
jgi:hypothetical protein